MRVIIVDDESGARTVLRTFLQECDEEVEVLAEAGSVPEAVKVINQHNPELVFLDVEMPGQNGFSLFEYFEDIDFQVIFVTASRDHAIDAFKVSALDYILKPIDQVQLCKAVAKGVEIQPLLREQVNMFKNNAEEKNAPERIALSTSESIEFVAISDILFLKADGAYTEFYLAADKKITVSKPLGEYAFLEKQPHFMKTHRSYLINLKQVKRFRKEDGGDIEMINGKSASLSRYRKDAFIEAMQQI
ncbi:MAG TPA: DNA-binding response regulator [Balneolaceae bacterium]|nr:DNA-binding response regulator [Balneolaceae bacterium]